MCLFMGGFGPPTQQASFGYWDRFVWRNNQSNPGVEVEWQRSGRPDVGSDSSAIELTENQMLVRRRVLLQ